MYQNNRITKRKPNQYIKERERKNKKEEVEGVGIEWRSHIVTC